MRPSKAVRAPSIAAILVSGVLSAGLTPPVLAGTFDYYALALSWSPTYCNTKIGQHDRLQCGSDRNYTFVVHGLWPQTQEGWPQHCHSREQWVPDDIIDRMLPIMPSKKLIIYQWKKHGTCSNLPMTDYFDLVSQLFGKVKIPARYLNPTAPVLTSPQELVDDFIATNMGLERSMLSVRCAPRRDRARLAELRVCFSLEGSFRSCGENERESCEAATLVLPPVRRAAASDAVPKEQELEDQ